MRTQPNVWPLAVSFAVLIGLSGSAWAEVTGRTLVADRQQVRAALAVARADGKLTAMEQYSILRKAKRLLPPHELEDLKQTLLQLSGGESATQPATAPDMKPTPARKTEAKATSVTETRLVAAEGKAQEQKTAKTAAYQEPAEPDEPAATGDENDQNPFKDEELPGQPPSATDLTRALSEGNAEYVEYEGFARLSNFGLFDESCESGSICLPDLRFSTSVDAFKGPLDLDNQNGNFGTQFAFNGGLMVFKSAGVGLQAGTSVVLSDFHGTRFTDSTIRTQSFTTVGLFQRLPIRARRVKWGFAFDWLYDEYYAVLTMSQWRIKMAYEFNAGEIGAWTCIADDGDSAVLRDGQGQFQFERFKPIAQGIFYYTHRWEAGATTTAWLGMADTPGQCVFGGDFRLPLTCSLGVIGNVNYVLPSASGAGGQDEEQWYVSVGIEFTPGRFGGNHSRLKNDAAPLFRLANNGNFAFRRF